jgi:transposase
VWVYGALRVRDGQALRQTARARNTSGYLELLQTLDRTSPSEDLYLIADNLASRHTSGPIRQWLEAHPRIQHAFIPVGAAWLNLIEGWWRIFRRKAHRPDNPWPMTAILPTSRASPPSTRVAMPNPGSGDDRPSPIASSGAVLCTTYEEHRISNQENIYA